MSATLENGGGAPLPMLQHHDILICPACGSALRASSLPTLQCIPGAHVFESDDGIPLLFWPTKWDQPRPDVTLTIKAFYEENPFPNYDDLDSIWSLKEKAKQSIFARWLDEQIPHGARILEVGCGTGQLSNYLATTWGRTVFGTDLSLTSLRLGEQFRRRHQLDNAAFLQMNLFRPVFKPSTFDLVICNGVLHHTSDPFLGFRSIAQLIKDDGAIIIGLYNRYGRVPTHIRRAIFKLLGNGFTFLDPRLRAKDLSEPRRQIWFMDQYRNPHESTHTFGEVLRWFDETGFEFTFGIPNPRAFEPLADEEILFAPSPRGSRLDHLFVQLGMLLRGGKEGGFFLMIGRKRGAAAAS